MELLWLHHPILKAQKKLRTKDIPFLFNAMLTTVTLTTGNFSHINAPDCIFFWSNADWRQWIYHHHCKKQEVTNLADIGRDWGI